MRTRMALDDEPETPAAGQRLIRSANERRVLTALRLQRRLTRADIARLLGLTRSTVTSLVDALLARDLLIELPGRAGLSDLKDLRPGRPGVEIGLNPEGAFFAGVEIGFGVLRCTLVDLALGQWEQRVETVPERVSVAEIVGRVGEFVDSLAANPAYGSRVRAVGLTVPGVVGRDGMVLNLPMIGWRQVDLPAAMKARIALPIVVENNANAAAFGEVYDRPSPFGSVSLFLKLGAGCGGAAILGGRLLGGGSGSATEFGHIRVSDDGPICSCGQTGCLEPRVNLQALRRCMGDLADIGTADRALPARMAALVEAGDVDAIAGLEQMTVYLARGLVTLTHIFNPRLIVLGGVLRPLLRLALPRLRRRLGDQLIPGMEPPDLALSRLGEFECAAGAAMITHHQASDVADFDLLSRMQGKRRGAG